MAGTTDDKATMTPRQRYLAVFDGGEPDRLVTDYWATPELHARLKQHLGCDSDEALWRELSIDRPRFFAPVHRCGGKHPRDPEADIWGVRHKNIDYGTGSYDEIAHCPLATAQSVEDLHAHDWPSADDFDYEPLARALDADDGHRIRQGGWYEPFLRYCAMRGMEQAFEDLVLNPEIAEAALARIFDFHHEQIRRVFELAQGRIDMIYLAEDLGGQTGPLMSLATYRRFLMPNQQRMAKLAHDHGVRVFYHTDGSARPFLDDLVDHVGIDMLNPIQWRCPGMEREPLVRDFASRIAFHGAMDNQHTLPFAGPDDVVAELHENLEIFGSARWVCAPCHNIQPVTPVENVVALYRAVQALAPRR